MRENSINIIYFENSDNLEFRPSPGISKSEMIRNNTSCDLLLEISDQIQIDYFSEDDEFIKQIPFTSQYGLNDGSIIYAKFSNDSCGKSWDLRISYLDGMTSDEIPILSKTETFSKKTKTQYLIIESLVKFLQMQGSLKDSYSFKLCNNYGDARV